MEASFHIEGEVLKTQQEAMDSTSCGPVVLNPGGRIGEDHVRSLSGLVKITRIGHCRRSTFSVDAGTRPEEQRSKGWRQEPGAPKPVWRRCSRVGSLWTWSPPSTRGSPRRRARSR